MRRLFRSSYYFQSYDIENYIFKVEELGMSGSVDEDRVAKPGSQTELEVKIEYEFTK